MLSNFLYNICILLNSSFNCTNYKSNTEPSSYINLDVYKNIVTKNTFYSEWRKKLNHVYSNFHFNYKYEVLNQSNNLIKIKLNIIKSFSLTHPSSKLITSEEITSSCTNNYLIILECSDEAYKNIVAIISEEENSLLYNKYIKEDLSFITTDYLRDVIINDTLLWQHKISNISYIYNTFLNSLTDKSQLRVSSSHFNIKDACHYAEKYALIPNPDYKNYDKIGGDCTNFVSQILHAGGIDFSHSWKPYTNPWLRVEELYNHIINNKLGKKLPDDAAFQKGSMIQFFTPQKGYYFHSGFITHVLPLNEAFYCCHSYNKLNYPLSEIYPVIYPGIRCVALY